MNRIILFRYHTKPLVCKDRISQLKYFNPGIKIYGLYGGQEADFPKYDKSLGSFFEHNYCIKHKSDVWKWKNSDLTVRLWYKDVGKKIDFDMLHVIEWDLLLFGSMDDIYKNIPKYCMGLTALQPLKNVEHKWWWTTEKTQKKEWVKLLRYVKNKFGYNQQPYASLCPGPCLPKAFLEKYSIIQVPDLGNDELRFPLFGQVLDFELVDTEFSRGWEDPEIMKFFNCEREEISLDLIKRELNKQNGRKVFHPFRKRLKEASLAGLSESCCE